MRNLPEWPVAFFAVASLGAIAVPLNAWWTGARARIWLADSGAKLLIVRWRALERIDAAPRRPCRQLEHVIVSRAGASWPGRAARGLIGAAERLGRAARRRAARCRDRARRRCDDLLHQRHHRRAQGRARHASQPHHQHPLERLFERARGAAPRRGAARADAQDRACIVIPLFHVTACCASLMGVDGGAATPSSSCANGIGRGDGDHRARDGATDRRRADHRLAAARASRARATTTSPASRRSPMAARPPRPSWSARSTRSSARCPATAGA